MSEKRRVLWMGACLRCSGRFWVVCGDLGARVWRHSLGRAASCRAPVTAQVKTHRRFAHGSRLPPADTARNCSDPCQRSGEQGEPDCVLRPESKPLRCSQACTDRTVQRACQSPGATHPGGWTRLCACVPGREHAWAEWGICLWGPPPFALCYRGLRSENSRKGRRHECRGEPVTPALSRGASRPSPSPSSPLHFSIYFLLCC